MATSAGIFIFTQAPFQPSIPAPQVANFGAATQTADANAQAANQPNNFVEQASGNPPATTQDGFHNGQAINEIVVPARQANGQGKWVTTNVSQRGVHNFFQMLLNRTETLGDGGRLIGSEGKDFKNTIRDVTQEWQALTTSQIENLKASGFISVEKPFGESRVIKQSFLEGPDPWQKSGKSWYWQPPLQNEEFEFENLGLQ